MVSIGLTRFDKLGFAQSEFYTLFVCGHVDIFFLLLPILQRRPSGIILKVHRTSRTVTDLQTGTITRLVSAFEGSYRPEVANQLRLFQGVTGVHCGALAPGIRGRRKLGHPTRSQRHSSFRSVPAAPQLRCPSIFHDLSDLPSPFFRPFPPFATPAQDTAPPDKSHNGPARRP